MIPAAAAASDRQALAPRPLAILAGIVGLSALLSVALMLAPAHAAADVTHYKYWARLVTDQGISGAYSGTYPETAAIYPPVTMYGYWLAGHLYLHVGDPEFEMDRALGSRALTILVKLVAVVPHLVGVAAIYLLVAGKFGQRSALLWAAAYGLNPAALFDFAYWGQPDGVHAMFLAAGVWGLGVRRPYLAWASIGLALATKPQAWSLLPLLLGMSYLCLGIRGTLKGWLAAGAAVLVVCLPFLVYGTVPQLFTLPGLIAQTMPVASANAHNVWWLVTRGEPGFVYDSELVYGPLTFRQLAGLFALAILALAFRQLWELPRRFDPQRLFGIAAFTAFGWFLVTTRAHENHSFFVLPLLALAGVQDRFWGIRYWCVTLTLLLNMLMHDFSLQPIRDELFSPETWTRLQLANSGINVGLALEMAKRLWSGEGD
ncbi:MAG: hypothetical protein U0821_05635 [Chloroflexota bacterium]